jgi:hypothetical protein
MRLTVRTSKPLSTYFKNAEIDVDASEYSSTPPFVGDVKIFSIQQQAHSTIVITTNITTRITTRITITSIVTFIRITFATSRYDAVFHRPIPG